MSAKSVDEMSDMFAAAAWAGAVSLHADAIELLLEAAPASMPGPHMDPDEIAKVAAQYRQLADLIERTPLTEETR